jgi:hypothetical protein
MLLAYPKASNRWDLPFGADSELAATLKIPELLRRPCPQSVLIQSLFLAAGNCDSAYANDYFVSSMLGRIKWQVDK